MEIGPIRNQNLISLHFPTNGNTEQMATTRPTSKSVYATYEESRPGNSEPLRISFSTSSEGAKDSPSPSLALELLLVGLKEIRQESNRYFGELLAKHPKKKRKPKS